jgi:hypothetical protein
MGLDRGRWDGIGKTGGRSAHTTEGQLQDLFPRKYPPEGPAGDVHIFVPTFWHVNTPTYLRISQVAQALSFQRHHERTHEPSGPSPQTMAFTHIDTTEQRLIALWRRRGMSLGEIGGLLERPKSTISRQVKKIKLKSHGTVGRPPAVTEKDVRLLLRVNTQLVLWGRCRGCAVARRNGGAYVEAVEFLEETAGPMREQWGF